jgi:hypothetical protein
MQGKNERFAKITEHPASPTEKFSPWREQKRSNHAAGRSYRTRIGPEIPGEKTSRGSRFSAE